MVPQRVVLLACGSYNPITNMHLRMFELAKDSLQKTGRYKVVGGIISPVNDKYDKKDLASASHRCAMLRLALKSSDWIRLNTWEVEQTEWSQTAKVLRHVQSVVQTNCNNTTVATESPKNNTKKKRKVQRSPKKDSTDFTITSISEHEGPPQLKLLCGADLLESFAVPNLWKDEDIEDIVANYGLVCITRNGSNPQRFIYESDVLSRYENNIHIVTEWITNDISSTKIRRSLRRSESIKYLVQDPVIDYIHKHKLYQPVDNKLINHMVLSPEKDVPNVGYVNPPGCLPVPKHTEYNRSPSSGYGSGYDSSPTMHPLDVYDAQQEAYKDAVKDESDYENIDSGMETSNMAENDLELITVPVPSLTKKHMATNTSPARFKSLWGCEKGTVFDFEGYGREYAVPPESPKLLHDAMNWLESGRSPSKFKLVPGSPRKKDAVDGCHLHGLTGVSSLNSSFSKSSQSLRNLVGTSDNSLMSNSRPTHPGAGTNEIPVQQSDTLPNSKTNPLLNQSFHQRSNSDINASAIQTRSDILSNLQTRKCSNCNRPASTYDEVLRLSFTNLNQTSSHSSSLNDHMLIDIDDKPQPFPVDPKSTPNTAETKTSLTSNESNCSEESSPRGSLPSSRNSGSSGSNNKGSINEIRTPNKPASRTFSDILKGVRNLRFGPCLPSETCV